MYDGGSSLKKVSANLKLACERAPNWKEIIVDRGI